MLFIDDVNTFRLDVGEGDIVGAILHGGDALTNLVSAGLTEVVTIAGIPFYPGDTIPRGAVSTIAGYMGIEESVATTSAFDHLIDVILGVGKGLGTVGGVFASDDDPHRAAESYVQSVQESVWMEPDPDPDPVVNDPYDMSTWTQEYGDERMRQLTDPNYWGQEEDDRTELERQIDLLRLAQENT
jgi:hypothetical protein